MHCNETNYASDYVTLYNGPNAGSPALQQQDGETEITKYHCGLMHDGDEVAADGPMPSGWLSVSEDSKHHDGPPVMSGAL